MYTKPLTIPWFKIIFAQFENEPLKRALQKCAREIECKIWYGEPGSVDMVEIPHFVAVFEWPLWSDFLSYLFLERCKKTSDDTPWIIIKKNNEHPFPVLEISKVKECLYVDTIDQDSINRIIAFIKEIKSNLREKILRIRKWKVINWG